jgi:hypothetical protein
MPKVVNYVEPLMPIGFDGDKAKKLYIYINKFVDVLFDVISEKDTPTDDIVSKKLLLHVHVMSNLDKYFKIILQMILEDETIENQYVHYHTKKLPKITRRSSIVINRKKPINSYCFQPNRKQHRNTQKHRRT